MNEIDYLINFLLNEMPQVRESAKNIDDKEILLRSLMNIRPPMKLNEDFLRVQDKYLSHQRAIKGVIDVDDLPEIFPHISLWQGDITRLKADAIVNAANEKLLGCFVPCHSCIDNAIHSSAGLQLRDECNKLMLQQSHDEPTGHAKITNAYNLPAKYVIHTVGPIVYGELTQKNCDDLRNCYISCLELAENQKLKSIVFCCISTGEFRFPNETAAKIAVNTVKEFLSHNHILNKIIFNVFKNQDLEIYTKLLNKEFVNHD